MSLYRFSLALGFVGGIFGYAPTAVAQTVSERPSAKSAAMTEYLGALEAYEKGDYKAAFRVIERYAIQGDPNAQYKLGVMYYLGNGVPQDFATAAIWYRRAAEQGSPSGQRGLGGLYYVGQGMPQDYESAAMWYRRAAEQGDRSAQRSLGHLYYMGFGVPQDFVLAHKWSNLAAANGDPMAPGTRNLVAKKMSPGQIAEAQRLAREWRKKEE
ncbi:tetratricopeptide repeat protein [Aquidulcibacter sp.]|uniref:tetratricopeptide repeat protein n=1 Tax=Aquidulcibacter sp. TaxID=2052990 RepID=UPI003BA6BFBD